MALRTETQFGLTFGWKPNDGSGAAQTPNWHLVATWMQATVLSVEADPPVPAQDARYLVANTGTTGLFVGQENKVAWNDDGTWRFYAAKEGYKVVIINQNRTVKFDAGTGTWKPDPVSAVNTPSGNRVLAWSDAEGAARWKRASEAVSELECTLAYSSGRLASITYSDGTTKTFSYTGDKLTSVMWVRELDTLEKTFSYSGDDLTAVAVAVTPNP